MPPSSTHGAFKRHDTGMMYVPGVDVKGTGPELITRSKEMVYVSLHHHSTFSFLDGFGLPDAHVRRAADLGMPALALTEHGNVSSHVGLEQASNKYGVKPIFGCEIYTGNVNLESRSQRKNHLTVLAENQAGYRSLLRMVSQGWEDFYYEPTVSGRVLLEQKDGLVILSGCLGSLLVTSLIGGKNISEEDASFDRARSVASHFKREFNGNYYLEVQSFPELEKTRVVNTALEELGKLLKIPLVATGDVHYTQPSENELQQILHSVRAGGKQTLEEQARNWGYDINLCPPTSDSYIYKRLRATGLSARAAEQAVRNAGEIASRCTVELPKLQPVRFPLPRGYRSIREVWLDWLRQGWEYRNIDRRGDVRAYRRQLKKEMRVIEEKDFIDYFLIVSDVVKFAKDHGIPVGPARGSAAASLVCYLLRITEVDPLQFPNLVFERFIDKTRADLPDIDLDFDDERRREIRDYLVAKYGAEKIGNIGTFTAYKSKLALDDVARVYRIPKYEVEVVKELLIERSSGDLRASATIEDTIDYFEEARAVMDRHPDLRRAMDFEGQYKGMGVHSAGLVVASEPLTDVCAVYSREVKGETTEIISTNKYDSEYLNIIKIDVLGLSTMGLIRRVLEEVGMSLEDLYGLDLDDEKVIDGFRNNDVVGIFQFDGRAMRSVNAELQPDSFKEICDVNALARPGPLHNNASAEYIDVKRGRKKPRRIHPMLDAICSDTHYQVVYQEQILRIVREIGNFDWTHAAYIRKIISRKIGEQEFNRQWDRFWEGARSHGLSEEDAKKIWGLCITAGSYAFNAAHCVSYGMIAYWTMYLKVYYPLNFYAAALSKYNVKKQLELLRDANRHGIDIKPPEPGRSKVTWSVDGDRILAGYSQIPGIGHKTAERLVQTEVGEWKDITQLKGIGPKTAAKCEKFCKLPDPFDIHKLHNSLEAVRKWITMDQDGLPWPTHTSVEVPYQRGQDEQVVWMGMIRHRNLRDLFEVNLSRTGEALDPTTVRDPQLPEWVIMIGYDEGELLSITIDRWKYPKFKKMIWGLRLNHDIVLCQGVKRGYQSRRAIYISRMWVINPE